MVSQLANTSMYLRANPKTKPNIDTRRRNAQPLKKVFKLNLFTALKRIFCPYINCSYEQEYQISFFNFRNCFKN